MDRTPQTESPLCCRVTGSSATDTARIGRIGTQRPDGRWHVLCASAAWWLVDGTPACDRDVTAIAEAIGRAEVTLTRLPRPTDVRRPRQAPPVIVTQHLGNVSEGSTVVGYQG